MAVFLALGIGNKNDSGGSGDKHVVDDNPSWSKSKKPYAETNADGKLTSDDVYLLKRFLFIAACAVVIVISAGVAVGQTPVGRIGACTLKGYVHGRGLRMEQSYEKVAE